MPTGRRAALALILSIILLTGCLGVGYVTPKAPTTVIPDESSEVKIGEMERVAVRNLLGAPQFSSAYWAFDLFRTEAEQAMVMFAITPWPIPFGRVEDKLQRYTLVTYDANGLASAVATDIFRMVPGWRTASPIESNFLWLHLRAGEVLFFVDPSWGREGSLLVSPRGRDAFLERARSLLDCTAILGCGLGMCADQFSVDARPVRRLPLRNSLAYRSWTVQGVESQSGDVWKPGEALVALRLAAGEHVVRLSSKNLDGENSLAFTCRPGEVTYLVINLASRHLEGSGQKMQGLANWQVDQTLIMPQHFARWPLVLVDNGQWYIDAEPSK
jgi:hypothetical protein